MNRLGAGAALLLVFTAMTLFAQTTTPDSSQIQQPGRTRERTKDGEESCANSTNSLTPGQGDWTFSAGGAILGGTTTFRFRSVPLAKSSDTGYGGCIAGEYFVTRAISLEGELLVVNRAQHLSVVSASETEFVLDLGAKLYPLQLGKLNECRVQPFAKIAFGGIFYDLSDAHFSISADPNVIIRVGGGVDLLLNKNWSTTVEADYYSTLQDGSETISGLEMQIREDGVLVTWGLRYRFW